MVKREFHGCGDRKATPVTDRSEQNIAPAAPIGVLTFLIADIRGYSRFTATHGDEAAVRLASAFADIVEATVVARGGTLVELRGDEALAAFQSPREALRAAVDVQRRFGEVATDDLPLRVGIGIDAGEALRLRNGFRGGALNLAARLCSAAGAGEILASDGVIHLAGTLDDLDVRARGHASFHGMTSPVLVQGVGAAGSLPLALPELIPRHDDRQTNLPDPPSPLIGRRADLERVAALVHDPAIRLVTLTGTGGSGKTRLALEVASILLDDFPGGVYFVPLATVTDASLVISRVAEVIGAGEVANEPPIETVIHRLSGRRVLLVVDNLEQLPDALPVIAGLLDACFNLSILATSRSVLRLTREHEYRLEPLTLPGAWTVPEDLLEADAVRFFVERARAVKPQFSLDEGNAAAVVELVTRLDGLPLALELAAARIRLFPLSALVARLTRRLDVLTGGARDAPTRQQTLRGAIDWSYSLLQPDEQRLFRCLAVFSGGWDFEAAEAVCGDEIDVLNALQSLVEQSLVVLHGDDEPRYRMLETVLEYAAERLAASGELEEAERRHTAHYRDLVQEAAVGLEEGQQTAWLARLHRELDNVHATLRRAHAQGDAETLLLLSGWMWRFWWIRAHLHEGRGWLDGALAMPGEVDAVVRARALNGAGNLAWALGDYESAETRHREALTLRQASGDLQGEVRSLNNLGAIAETRERYSDAAGFYRAALDIARETSDPWVIALALGNLGGVQFVLGEREAGVAACEESLALYRQVGDGVSENRALNSLVYLLLELHDHARALPHALRSLHLVRDAEIVENAAVSLDNAAALLVGFRGGGDAALLWGAAEAQRDALYQAVPPNSVDDRAQAMNIARAEIGAEPFAAALAQGRTLPAEQAVALAIDRLERLLIEPRVSQL
jgi:predicted ATPase/class 3 adenylate cyclase